MTMLDLDAGDTVLEALANLARTLYTELQQVEDLPATVHDAFLQSADDDIEPLVVCTISAPG